MATIDIPEIGKHPFPSREAAERYRADYKKSTGRDLLIYEEDQPEAPKKRGFMDVLRDNSPTWAPSLALLNPIAPSVAMLPWMARAAKQGVADVGEGAVRMGRAVGPGARMGYEGYIPTVEDTEELHKHLQEHPDALPEFAGGLNQSLSGALTLATPAIIPSLAAAPAKTLLSLGTAYAAQAGTQTGLEKLGVDPRYAGLAGTVVGAGAGIAAHTGANIMEGAKIVHESAKANIAAEKARVADLSEKPIAERIAAQAPEPATPQYEPDTYVPSEDTPHERISRVSLHPAEEAANPLPRRIRPAGLRDTGTGHILDITPQEGPDWAQKIIPSKVVDGYWAQDPSVNRVIKSAESVIRDRLDRHLAEADSNLTPDQKLQAREELIAQIRRNATDKAIAEGEHTRTGDFYAKHLQDYLLDHTPGEIPGQVSPPPVEPPPPSGPPPEPPAVTPESAPILSLDDVRVDIENETLGNPPRESAVEPDSNLPSDQLNRMVEENHKLRAARDSEPPPQKPGILESGAEWVKRKLNKLDPYGDYERAFGNLQRREGISYEQARDFQKWAKDTIPDKARREGITEYIAAGGDEAKLTDRLALSADKFKPAYAAALDLNPEEKLVAKVVGKFYDSWAGRLQREGVLPEEVLKDYINRIWAKQNPAAGIRRLLNKISPIESELASGRLSTNFKNANKRVFESNFEGEQAGYTPATKDFSELMAVYDQHANNILARRNFVRDLQRGVGEDGRPLTQVTGGATVPEEPGAPIRVSNSKPRTTTAPSTELDLPEGPDFAPPERARVGVTTEGRPSDYVTIDHPSLKGYKWLGDVGPDSSPLLYEGNIAIHPGKANHLDNYLRKSAFDVSNTQSKIPLPGRLAAQAVLKTGNMAKNIVLSLPAFHQIALMEHAAFHGVNPTRTGNVMGLDVPEVKIPGMQNIRKVSLRNDPSATDAVAHGATLILPKSEAHWVDSMRSTGLMEKIPGLRDWTADVFDRQIPEMKLVTYEKNLKKSIKAYGKQLEDGTITLDELKQEVAKQVNAAYGGINYNYIGRNKTAQDMFRMAALAPDFLEARAKFLGQSLAPYGAAQRRAMGYAIATQWLGTRIMNKVYDDDYHFEKPFSLIKDGKEYSIRTIPSDTLEAGGSLLDWLNTGIGRPGSSSSFFMNRESMMARPIHEALSGKDYKQHERTIGEQAKDALVGSAVPSVLQPLFNDNTPSGWKKAAWAALSVRENSATPIDEMRDKASRYARHNGKTNPIQMLQESPYKKLADSLKQQQPNTETMIRVAKSDKPEAPLPHIQNEKIAIEELQKLAKAGKTKQQIMAHFSSAANRPFTGDKGLEEKLYWEGLDDRGRDKYLAARAAQDYHTSEVKRLLDKVKFE